MAAHLLHRQSKCWKNCTAHLLDIILEKVKSTKDVLQFGVVCREWHILLKHNRSEVVERSLHGQVPMLLLPDRDETRIYNVVENRILSSKLSVPCNKPFSGSSHGWLVGVSRDMYVTLYKPFAMVKDDNVNSKHTITLPRLICAYRGDEDLSHYANNGIHVFDNMVRRVLITSDPLENPSECIVYFTMDDVGIAFHRLTGDFTWTMVDHKLGYAEDAFLYKNQLYASFCGALLSLDLNDPSNHSSQEMVAPKVPGVSGVVDMKYVVESNCGNLWFVVRTPSLFHTMSFRVFQLDFDKREWTLLENIGDRALFVGENSSICVNSSDFMGCKPNCIYFTNDIRRRRIDTDIGLYHIDSGMIESHFGFDTSIITSTARPIWFVPSLNV